MDRIRIGIAGAGKIVRDEHVPRFRAIEGVDLVGVANRTRASSERAAAELGLGRAYADWGELVEDPDLDAVLVGTWPYLHAPVAVAALEFGKHVLTEARMAASADAARSMLAASMEHPALVAQVVPASFSVWADRAIQRVLASDVGRLLAVRVEWDGGAGDDPSEHWRWQRRYSGSNVMALGHPGRGDGALARASPSGSSAETRNYRPRKPARGRTAGAGGRAGPRRRDGRLPGRGRRDDRDEHGDDARPRHPRLVLRVRCGARGRFRGAVADAARGRRGAGRRPAGRSRSATTSATSGGPSATSWLRSGASSR